MNPIPYGRQHITDEDIEQVRRVLQSDFITSGPEIEKFEQAFAQYINSRYAVAVANGTAALHLAAIALDVKPGQRVITTPITFAATANCIKFCGGEIDFCDIDPETYLIDLNKLEQQIGSKPRGYYSGVIPVDFAGYPVDMERLKEISDEHGLWIIEDACHAPGGFYLDSDGVSEFCGSCKNADIAIFSFHPVKHIAAGEGGMITTNDETIYQRIKKLRTHGITKDPQQLTENHGGWYYEMQELGYNYRLTDFQAALANSQLRRANEGLKRRAEIARKYDLKLDIEELKLPFRNSHISHAFHLYVVQTGQRKALYDYLVDNKIFAQIHYIPVHLLPYYQNIGWKIGDFPIAEAYYEKCISLPMYPSLSDAEQDYVIKKIRQFFGYE